MRLPKEAQLSAEQKEVCFAVPEGTTLVIGPPGSGKTVAALYRARSIEKRGEDCQLLVYNHVLKRFTATGDTFLKWLGDWWRSCTGRPFPYTFEEVTQGDYVRRNRVYDYDGAAQDAKNGQRKKIRTKGHWGHVVLDEAQDFPKGAHKLLFIVQNFVFDEMDDDERPSMMILADENQRLTSGNSTIDEIREAHMLNGDDLYELRKNYRNTREIALFARTFYVGLESGQPELPSSRGEKPTVSLTSDIDDAVKRIVNYAKAHEDQEIAVLVFHHKTRKKFFNKLSHQLRNTAITIQTYTSDRKDPNNDPRRLTFDTGGTVTVICFASGKGLEFDAVFLPELQTFPVAAEARDDARMMLYVMTSRARQRLFLMVTDPDKRAEVWDLLPSDSKLFDMED